MYIYYNWWLSLCQWSNPSNVQSDTFPVKFSSACYAISGAITKNNNNNTSNNGLCTGGLEIPSISTSSLTIHTFRMSDEQYNRCYLNQNFTGRWIAIGK